MKRLTSQIRKATDELIEKTIELSDSGIDATFLFRTISYTRFILQVLQKKIIPEILLSKTASMNCSKSFPLS